MERGESSSSAIFPFGGNQEEDDNIMNRLPSGYRFHPSDQEIIAHYLIKKISNCPLPPNKIIEVDLSKYNPEDLAAIYNLNGEKNLYFFTHRVRKYQNGRCPNRAPGDGFWKATGLDKKIYINNQRVGYKRSLVFYRGKSEKTNWIMHEYVADANSHLRLSKDGMMLNEYVLCMIYENVTKPKKAGQAVAGQKDPSRTIEDSTFVSNEDIHVYVVNESNLPMISENAQVCNGGKAIHEDLTHVHFNQSADSLAMISMDAHVVNEPIPIEDSSHAVNQFRDSSDNNGFGDSSRCHCGALLGCCLCDPSLVLDYWVDSISSEISFESSPPNEHAQT